MWQMTGSEFIGICALPLLGFMLGAMWKRQQDKLPPPRHPQEVTPVPLESPGLNTQVLDALDTVQAQLAELAERQDFTERLLTREPRRLVGNEVTPVPTPV